MPFFPGLRISQKNDLRNSQWGIPPCHRGASVTIHSIRRARGELYVVAQCVYQFQVRLFRDPGPVPIPYKGLSLSVVEGAKRLDAKA